MEELKKALWELAKTDKEFLRRLFLEVFSDGGGAALVDFILADPAAKTRLLGELAKTLAVPLNVATREDITRLEETIKRETARLEEAVKKLEGDVARLEEDVKKLEGQMEVLTAEVRQATQRLEALEKDMREVKAELARLGERVTSLEGRVAKLEDRVSGVEERVTRLEERVAEIGGRLAAVEGRLARIENKMVTREMYEHITLTLEEAARDVVEWLLRQRGVSCRVERLWLDGEYEFDIYCVAGGRTYVGEAKVRAGPRDVERTAARVREAAERWPERFPGAVVPVLYCDAAHPSAVEKARELGVWLIENFEEKTPHL